MYICIYLSSEILENFNLTLIKKVRNIILHRNASKAEILENFNLTGIQNIRILYIHS